MGNTPSTVEEKVKFGSIYPSNGKVRPGYYFRNNKSTKVIYKGNEIPIMENEEGFQKLKFGYLKSNLRVFYNGLPIFLANPATFSVITRNNVNSLSKIPEKNKEFLKLNSVLGMDFIGNKKRIYFKDRIIHEE